MERLEKNQQLTRNVKNTKKIKKHERGLFNASKGDLLLYHWGEKKKTADVSFLALGRKG